MNEIKGKFLTGSLMGHILRMTITGTVGITFIFLVDVINLFWISWLGDVKLVAAMGFAFSIQFFSVSVGIGLMIATTAVVSRSIGQGDRLLAGNQATSTVIIAVMMQVAVVILIVIFREDFLWFMGAKGETATLASRYLLFSLPSLPVMALGMSGSAILRAEGDGVGAMLVTIIPGVIAVFIDPFLIVFLELGLDGAAYGIWVSRIIMAIIALWIVLRTHDLLAKPNIKQTLITIGPYFAVAGPTILTQLSTPVGNYLLTGVVAGFGDSAVAAWAVINRLTVLSFGGLFSLSGAIGGIFGQNFGAKNYVRLSMTFKDGLIFCLAYTAIIWVALLLLTDLIAKAFNLDDEGTKLVWVFTHFTPVAYIFSGTMFVACAAFNNTGKPLRSTMVNWLRDGVLTFPAALWLSGVFASSGVIYAQGLVFIFVGLITTFWGLVYIRNLAKLEGI